MTDTSNNQPQPNDGTPDTPPPASQRKRRQAFGRSPLSGKQPVFKSAEQRKKFFAALALNYSIDKACRVTGCTRQTIYNERDRNPEFADELELTRDAIRLDYFIKMNDLMNKTLKTQKPEWKILSWLMERVFPNDFGARDPDTVSPEQFAARLARISAIAMKSMTPEQAAEFNRELLQGATGSEQQEAANGEQNT